MKGRRASFPVVLVAGFTRGQSCSFGYTGDTLRLCFWTGPLMHVWMCVCVWVKRDVGLVRHLSDGLISIQVCQASTTRPSEVEKKEEGGQQRQTMRFCDAFISQYNLRLHSTNTWCAEDVGEEFLVIWLFFLYFFYRTEQIPLRFHSHENRNEISNRKPKETS